MTQTTDTSSMQEQTEEAVREILRRNAVDDLGEAVVNGIARELSIIASKSAEGFSLEILPSLDVVSGWTAACEGYHTQQVAFSTHHKALTQICFTCRKIRTNMVIKDKK